MKKLLVLFLVIQANLLYAEERLRLATTTSTDNSGLLAELHPPFEKQHGVKVDIISVGTGKAIRLAENGDVDVILVHAPPAEMKFVNAGFGIERLPVMHNDFILLGPVQDPARAKTAGSVMEAMQRIADTENPFISRGDESGTHKKELSIWQSTGISPEGKWYLSAGQGMGAVLNIANDKLAYTLADRGTYLALKNKLDLTIIYSGDEILFNPYHVILVNPEKHPHTRIDLARQYSAFIRGETGQMIIGNFRIAGEQLFIPDVINQ